MVEETLHVGHECIFYDIYLIVFESCQFNLTEISDFAFLGKVAEIENELSLVWMEYLLDLNNPFLRMGGFVSVYQSFVN